MVVMEKKKNNDKKVEIDYEDWQEKQSKLKIILFSLAILIIICLIGYFAYFYVFLSTERFMDTAVSEFSNMMDNVFADINDNVTIDENEKDYELNGKLTIGNFDAKVGLINSQSKKLTSFDIDTKQNNSDLFKLNVFRQDDYIYLDSKDIYKEKLAIKLEGDLFNSEYGQTDFNYDILTNSNDLKYYLVKIVEYHFEAMKEGRLTTSFKGINEKEYRIKLSATEKLDANKRLNELVNSDDKLKSIIERYNIEDYNYLTTGEIAFTINTISNEIKGFEISTSDIDIKGKREGEKFILESDGSAINILVTDGKIEIEEYSKDVLLGKFVIEYKDDMKLTFSSNDVELDVLINKENEKTLADIKLKASELEGSINLVVSKESDNKHNIFAKGSILIYDEKFDIDINFDYIKDDNLIEKVDTKSIKDVSDLTEDEQRGILTNMYNLINKLGIYDESNLGI